MYGGTNLFNTTGVTLNTGQTLFNTAGVTLNTGTHFGSLTGQPGFPLNTSFRETVNQSQLTNVHRSMKGSIEDKSAVTAQGQAILLPDFRSLPIDRKQGEGGFGGRIEYTGTWGGAEGPKHTIGVTGEAHDGKGNSVGGRIEHSSDGTGRATGYIEKQAGHK